MSRLFDSKLSIKETFGIGTFLSKFKKKQNVIQQEDKDNRRDNIGSLDGVHTK